MSDKKLIFIIVAEQGFISTLQDENNDSLNPQNEILFGAITQTYIPLLNMLSKLENEKIPFKLSLVLSPVTCTLLKNEGIQRLYIEYLDRRIALGDEELERNKNDSQLLDLCRKQITAFQKCRVDFIDTYKQDLVAKFKEFVKKKYIEIIPTAATYAYLPQYASMAEALNAQIETGLQASRHFFSDTGYGFYLPYLGFTEEIEERLRAYNVSYTILDTKALLFSEGYGGGKGIFSPVRGNRSLVFFTRDPDTPSDISGNSGFMTASCYKNQQSDVGYDLPGEYLESFLGNCKIRVQTLYKYRNNLGQTYSFEEAEAQVEKDALAFYQAKKAKLEEAASILNDDAQLVCLMPAELLGQTWAEGLSFFEQVIRLVAKDGSITLSSCNENIQKQYSLTKIKPYQCGGSGTGYGEDLVDSSNSFLIRHVRTATERMIDLTGRFPSETGLKARLLAMGAREVLLAQSGEWPKMIHEGKDPDWAERSFTKNILSFTNVFDSLASNTVSTEWLTNMEKDHAIFPWLNYRVFARKK